jgi:hypothetical protein
MPVFVSRNILTGKLLGRVYSDDDPVRLLGESVLSTQEAEGMWEDGVAGADFVVERLHRLLKNAGESAGGAR